MTDELKPKRKKGPHFVFYAISKLTDWIYRKANSGFIGHLFSSYTKKNRTLKNSFFVKTLGGQSKFASKLRHLRFAVAEQFEESRLLGTWRRCMRFLGRCRLRFYGSFILTFGIYTGLVYFIKRYVLGNIGTDSSYIAFAVILSLVSIPLLISKRTLSGAVIESRFGRFLAVKTFGIPLEKFEHTTTRHGESYNLAIIVGIIAGSLTYLISPIYILAAIAAIAAIALVISYPEVGVIAAIATLPLCSVIGHGLLNVLTVLYSVSYLFKLLRGKRIVSFEITDLFILFFGILVLLGGFVSAGNGAETTATSALILMFGCFVAGNLMRTRHWQTRAVLAFGFSGYVVSLCIIWQAVSEFAGRFWAHGLPKFEKGLNFFGSRNLLSTFLLVTLLVIFSLHRNAISKKGKFAARSAALAVLTALILTDSRVELLVAAVAVFIYFVIMSRNTLPIIFFSGLGVSTAVVFAPRTLIKSITSFLGISPKILHDLVNLRQGCYDMILSSWFSGVGTGGFSEVYPLYSAAGFENAVNSGSTWLGVLAEQGVVGLLLLAAGIFLVVQNCCEYLKHPFGIGSKALVAAGFSAFVAIMLQSVFVDVWGDPCMFFLFWMIPTMLTAGIRTCRREEAKSRDDSVGNEYSASVDI